MRGVKQIEIRNWSDPYRGDLYVHTGKMADGYKIFEFEMPNVFRGGYVGIVEVVAVLPFTAERWEAWRDKHLSDAAFKEGLFAWVLRNPRRFQEPIPAPGSLNVFWPEPEVREALESMPVIDEKS